jgi:hypothetical protein
VELGVAELAASDTVVAGSMNVGIAGMDIVGTDNGGGSSSPWAALHAAPTVSNALSITVIHARRRNAVGSLG